MAVIVVWAIVQVVLLLSGIVWLIHDIKKRIRRYSPYLLIFVGLIMTGIFFYLWVPMIRDWR